MQKAIGKIKKLWANFSDKDYRDAFMESRLREGVAAQIYFIRESRKLTQGELAALVGTKQPAISRIERGEAALSLSSLESIAKAFDVALSVKFVPHSEIIDEVVNGRLEAYVPPFADDVPAGLEAAAILSPTPYRISRISGFLPTSNTSAYSGGLAEQEALYA